MNIKSLIASLLLAIFSVVIIPKNWIHHCDTHTYTHHDHTGSTIQKIQLKCAICEYKISTSTPTVEAPESFVSIKRYESGFFYLPLSSSSIFHSSKGRAPPVC